MSTYQLVVLFVDGGEIWNAEKAARERKSVISRGTNRETERGSLFEGAVVVLEALLEVRGDDDEGVDDRLEAVAEVGARGEALLDLVGVKVRAEPGQEQIEKWTDRILVTDTYGQKITMYTIS